jgi:hypothetical protein
MWSAMSSSEPPSRTHASTAAISSGVNADGVGSTQSPSALRALSALAITSTRAPDSDSRVNGSRSPRTPYPSRRSSCANA